MRSSLSENVRKPLNESVARNGGNLVGWNLIMSGKPYNECTQAALSKFGF